MIYRKDNPVGTEIVIDKIQRKLFSVLLQKWGIESVKYKCFPKVFRNQNNDGSYVAEWYDGKDYQEAYFDDTVYATSFFGITGESTFSADGVETTNVHVVFFVDLSNLRAPAPPQRNDELIRLDVQEVLAGYGEALGCVLTKAGAGIEYSLKEYQGSRKDMGLKFRDQHPLHCFRFDFQTYYQPTQKRCNASQP